MEGEDGCCSVSTRRTRSRSRARRSCRFDLFGAAAVASLGGSGTGAGAAVTGAVAGAAFSSTLITSGFSGSGSEEGAAAFSSADGWTRTPWDDSSSLRESPFFNSTGTSAGFGSIEGSAAAGFDVGSSTGFSSSAGGFAAAGPSSATSDALRAPSFLDVAHPMIVRRFSVFFLVECVCAVGAGWGVQWPFSTPLELLVLPVCKQRRCEYKPQPGVTNHTARIIYRTTVKHRRLPPAAARARAAGAPCGHTVDTSTRIPHTRTHAQHPSAPRCTCNRDHNTHVHTHTNKHKSWKTRPGARCEKIPATPPAVYYPAHAPPPRPRACRPGTCAAAAAAAPAGRFRPLLRSQTW